MLNSQYKMVVCCYVMKLTLRCMTYLSSWLAYCNVKGIQGYRVPATREMVVNKLHASLSVTQFINAKTKNLISAVYIYQLK